MENKRGFLVLIILFAVLSALAIYASFRIEESGGGKVCFSETCVDVETAATSEEWRIGLMFRESLGENQGMLFVFPEEKIYSFWMKDTLIPLDMIWINENFEVVEIKSVQPCVADPCETYTPTANAKYVLEVNSGFAEKNGIKIGDPVVVK